MVRSLVHPETAEPVTSARFRRAPVYLFGLDACEPALLLEWASRGILPHLQRLLECGVSATVKNAVGLHGGSAWSSFSTGRSPGGHGRFCRRQAPLGAYVDEDHLPEHVGGKQFWGELEAAGRRVCVVDIPQSKPCVKSGTEVIDWVSHDPHYEDGWVSEPALRDELARFGRPQPDSCQRFDDLSARATHFVEIQRERIRAKLRAAQHCLNRGPWDFFATVLAEGHCAGHRCWHLHDAAHPDHDAEHAALVGNPVQAVYQALDRAIGELVASMPEDATVIVLSSHGMGPVFTAENSVVDEWLRRLEGTTVRSRGALFGRLKRSYYALPASLRQLKALGALQRKLLPPFRERTLVPDRRRRRYFAIPNDRYAAAVRINLRGREGEGMVHPSEYEAVCEEVRRGLLQLKCVDSGQPLVYEVSQPRSAYPGPRADELPDLVFEWRRERPVRRVFSERLGSWTLPEMNDRSGDHLGDGLFIGVRPGLTSRRLDIAVNIEDIAPTVAGLLDVELPGIDGRPIEAMF